MERFLIRKTKDNPIGSSVSLITAIATVDEATPPSPESSRSSIDSPSSEDDAGRQLGGKSKKKMKDVVPAKQRLTEQTEKQSIRPHVTDSPNDQNGSCAAEDLEGGKREGKWKKKYKQKFKSSWTTKFPWLELKNNQAFCKACLKVVSGGKTHLERHEYTSLHQAKVKSAANTVAITDLLGNEQQQTRNKQVQSAELKMTMFLHEHNLPFRLIDHLPKFIASVCPDSQVAKSIKCARTKATSLTKDCLAAQHVAEISEKLRNSVYSLIIDETTDVSCEKSLAIVARFYDDGEAQTKDTFLGLVKVLSCTAEALYNAICQCLEVFGIPLANMIGFAADNASVMMGSISGVQARFKEVIPSLFVLGCVCHSFHLCSSLAAQKLPSSTEELVRGIYNYFAHSSKRQERLQEFQAFVDLKPHKMLHPSQTRWLSLQAAVDRVLENWDALILFFTNECFEDNCLSSTRTILGRLKFPIFRVYFTFLSYVLDLVNKLNVEFQAEKPKIHLLLSRVRGLYRTILRNFIEVRHLESVPLNKIDLNDSRIFVKLEKIYFGAKTDLLLANEDIEPTELRNFKTRALAFYVALSEQIKMRFDFEDPTLLFVSQFNPVVALSGNVANISTEASRLFPQLVEDIEALNSEWRLLADLEELNKFRDSPIEEFWTQIFKTKNELQDRMFPSLTKLVTGILCLPHASAAAERVFSQLTLLKNKTRNRLHIDTVESVLHAKELLGKNTCYSWEPSSELLKRKPKYTASADDK